ncbi:hypothetical protein IFM89_000489 [Coptis chinensis]|uniref:Uncharacterized protein n=1 Tax=Coptis chinensis TaxID=261450 RepID=A0A835H293_9MAGN|nr:hypothetical protein IFM89_000489 [Coptis chinensis]
MNDFRDFMNNNQLMEVPNSGFQLTWWNKQVGDFKILGKLDRMLCNVNWSSTFPGWKYKVVSRIGSDHSPLMGGSISIPRPNNMPFKFFNMWCSHPKFKDVVMESWQEPLSGHSLYILTQKLKRLKAVLKKWNKETFVREWGCYGGLCDEHGGPRKSSGTAATAGTRFLETEVKNKMGQGQ